MWGSNYDSYWTKNGFKLIMVLWVWRRAECQWRKMGIYLWQFRDVVELGWISRRAKHKFPLRRGLERVACEDSLRTLGLSSLEKRRLECHHGFLQPPEDGTRWSLLGILWQVMWEWFEAVSGRFRLDIGKHLFSGRLFRCWTRLPREEAPSLLACKRHLDNAFNNTLTFCQSWSGQGLG